MTYDLRLCVCVCVCASRDVCLLVSGHTARSEGGGYTVSPAVTHGYRACIRVYTGCGSSTGCIAIPGC